MLDKILEIALKHNGAHVAPVLHIHCKTRAEAQAVADDLIVNNLPEPITVEYDGHEWLEINLEATEFTAKICIFHRGL